MNIEINSPAEEVKAWVLEYAKKKLIEIHHVYRNISSIHVNFRKHAGDMQRTCEIELEAYGDSLFISKEARSYENALRHSLDELSVRIDEWNRLKNEPPEETTSTVSV
jgi:hypothetical protein